MSRTGSSLREPHIETTNFTYGKYWGKDSGVEATTRLKSRGDGFEGWYGTPLHLQTSQSIGNPEYLENRDSICPESAPQTHFFGKDHWFMGAKNPNPSTLTPEAKEIYH